MTNLAKLSITLEQDAFSKINQLAAEHTNCNRNALIRRIFDIALEDESVLEKLNV